MTNRKKTSLIFGIVFACSFGLGIAASYGVDFLQDAVEELGKEFNEDLEYKIKRQINEYMSDSSMEKELKALFHYLKNQHEEILQLKTRVQELESKCSVAPKS